MDIPNTGKWVWEQRFTGYTYTRYWAITRRMRAQGEYLDSSAYVYYDMYDGKTVSALNGSVVTTLTGGQASYGDNTTRYWMMALDMDDMKARFYVNNVLQSTIAIPELPDDGKGNYVWTWTSTNGGSGSSLDDRFNFGQDSSFVGAVTSQYKTDANGIGDFYYTPPDNALALCSQNTPPNLTSTKSIINPEKHFGTLAYVGNGATANGENKACMEYIPSVGAYWYVTEDSNRFYYSPNGIWISAGGFLRACWAKSNGTGSAPTMTQATQTPFTGASSNQSWPTGQLGYQPWLSYDSTSGKGILTYRSIPSSGKPCAMVLSFTDTTAQPTYTTAVELTQNTCESIRNSWNSCLLYTSPSPRDS